MIRLLTIPVVREPYAVTDGGTFRDSWPNIGPSSGNPDKEREEGLSELEGQEHHRKPHRNG